MRQSNVRVTAARDAGDSWAEPSGSSAPVTTNPIPPGGGANRPVNGSVPAGSPDSAGLQRGTASEAAARSPASPSTRAATSAAAPINVRSPLPCAIPSAGNVLDPGNKAATAGVGPVDGSGRTGLNASALSVPLPALHDRRSAQDLGDSDGMSLGSGVAHLMSNDGPNADGVTYYGVGGNAPRERYLPGGEGEWVGSEKVRNKGPAAASKPRARGLRRLPSAFNPVSVYRAPPLPRWCQCTVHASPGPHVAAPPPAATGARGFVPIRVPQQPNGEGQTTHGALDQELYGERGCQAADVHAALHLDQRQVRYSARVLPRL